HAVLGPTQRPRILHFGGAQDTFVSRCECLADRRGGADHVDDDAGGGRRGLVRCERDVDSHAGYASRRWTSLCTATGIRAGRRTCPARSAAGASAPTAWSSHPSGSAAPTTRASAAAGSHVRLAPPVRCR